MGSLHIILGPMFAGKSTSLINKVQNLLEIGTPQSNIIVFNHQIDNRYTNDSSLATHDGKSISSIAISSINDILHLDDIISSNKYIFIDEAQFFTDLHLIKCLVFELGHTVYISGLDGDYKQEPFMINNNNNTTNPYCSVLSLIPLATTIVKLNAKCSQCDNIAPFTKRIVKSNEQILVGGASDYQPVCIKHLA